MSKFYQPPLYNTRGQQHQWINLIFQSHDIICGCNKPIDHLEDLIKQQKCHSTTENNSTDDAGGITLKDETGFDEGDLEKLFENTEEEQG